MLSCGLAADIHKPILFALGMILGQDQWEEDWEDDNKWRGKKWTSEKYDSYDRYDKRDKGKSGKNSKYDDYDEYDASESWDRAACRCLLFSFSGQLSLHCDN